MYDSICISGNCVIFYNICIEILLTIRNSTDKYFWTKEIKRICINAIYWRWSIIFSPRWRKVVRLEVNIFSSVTVILVCVFWTPLPNIPFYFLFICPCPFRQWSRHPFEVWLFTQYLLNVISNPGQYTYTTELLQV